MAAEKQTIGILLFEDVEELDFVGPMEVFGAASLMGASCALQLVAESVAPVRCRWGMRVIPDLSIAKSGPLDLVVIPGGPGARTHAFKNEEILHYVKLPHRYVMSVCTGSVILAASGLLTNQTATTHHAHLAKLREYSGVTVRDKARFVIGEGIATSGGVSAGIDLSLALVSRLWGMEIARKTAEVLEWQSTSWQGDGK